MSPSTCIVLIIKSSIICESLWHWSFRLGVFSSIAMFLSQGGFRVLVIHELVVYLVSGRKLFDNRDPEKPMSSLWDSMESLI